MKNSVRQTRNRIESSVREAGGRIAPSWQLKNMVAVNPYYGFTDKNFNETARILNSLGDIQLYMPLEFYHQRIVSGIISEADIQKALQKLNIEKLPEQLIFEVHLAMNNATANIPGPKTIADIAEEITNIKINDILIECVTNWISLHFNETDRSWQEFYSKPQLYNSWRGYATNDLTPRIAGIKNFQKALKLLPENITDVNHFLMAHLDIDRKELTNYVLKLSYKLPGWSSYVAGIDWDNNLYGNPTNCLQEFLTVLLCWEFCILKSFNHKDINATWKNRISEGQFTEMKADENFELKAILQSALDFAKQRELIQRFNNRELTPPANEKPDVQAVFCIDVRSEIYRRHLESANPKIQTLGFAGFFGFPIRYERPGTNVSLNQCPVLLPSGFKVTEPLERSAFSWIRLNKARLLLVESLVKGFRKSPVSSFGFVSPLGLLYLPKLITASYKEQKRSTGKVSTLPHIVETDRKIDITFIPFPERVKMAANALRGMGLTTGFARIVTFVGHGSTGVNNPHNAGLACGACGGNSGDINALTAARILNDQRVRQALKPFGIEIPEDTVFIAMLHDTAVDRMTILNAPDIAKSVQNLYSCFLQDLNTASEKTRIERGVKFFQPDPAKAFKLINRNLDWGQTRPEWGLAGCSSFIVAPRSKTKGIDLGGESFLHDYTFSEDNGLSVLEAIMTAPMVVTSWINLQYYASSVDNKTFGSGNKTLHNVTSGIGVIEGSSGDLRIGLPLQSVHNAKELEHQPFRLNVVIDAPRDAINSILEKHANVKALFDNQWISLLRMNSSGLIAERYQVDLNWETTV